MEARKILEQEFHNQRELDRAILDEEEFLKKYSNKKIYRVANLSNEYIEKWIKTNCAGKKVLDYCCGLGGTSLNIARSGGEVWGIDISKESVDTASMRLKAAGYENVSHFEVMDAENMMFENDKFDIIICSGVLHHLDTNKAFPELSRVLKPGGKILCHEALGYNPLIGLYRRRTMNLRTAWEADHILTMKDLKIARKYFARIDIYFFHLFAILAWPIQNKFLFEKLLKLFNIIDSMLMKIPIIQLMAWQMIFILSEPDTEKKPTT